MRAFTKLRLQSRRTEPRQVVAWLALGLAAASGCKQDQPAAPDFKVEARTQTVDLLAAKGVERFPGQHAIAAVATKRGLAILIDGGGPRYVSLGDALIEVCPTAGSIAAHAERLAVGCGSLGTSPPHVQLVGGLAVSSTIDFTVDAPMSSSFQWPVVDAKLEQVAVPSASGVSIARLDDPTTITAVDSLGPTSELASLEFSPSGRWLAVGRSDGSVELVAPGQPTTVSLKPEKEDQGPAVAFSAREDRVAVASFWGQFRLYSIDGELLASDATKQDHYGLNDVEFVAGHIVQIEAGTLVLRDLDGKRLSSPNAGAGPSKPFAPADLGALSFVVAAGDRSMVTIDGPGLVVTSLSL